MPEPNEPNKERARERLEDAVWVAVEAGMSKKEIHAEVDYALEDADD